MKPTPRLIAPHDPETGRSQVTTGGLPDDLLDEHLRRLRLCAGVAMGLWAFGLVMDGLVRPRTVGSELFVSFNTVKTHMRSIFRKLDVSTRAEAVRRARGLGLT